MSPPQAIADAPGAYRPAVDRWGSFARLSKRLKRVPHLVVIDRRVARLHRHLIAALPDLAAIIGVQAGERVKSLEWVAQLTGRALGLPRTGALVSIGGGTIGDLSTVAAHLIKRGVGLIHVPTTLLAAVDSTVGGKGAVHLRGPAGSTVKNAIGVFHYPDESWLCPELFETLTSAQLREGRIEAWKMAVCLSPGLWRRYRMGRIGLGDLVRSARKLKADICLRDPYERAGIRQVLNFGHTFGHLIESLTDFRVSHGDAVGLGMLCALDVGRALSITPPALAWEVERALIDGLQILGRDELKRALTRSSNQQLWRLLRADKKFDRFGLAMVLLRKIGGWTLTTVEPERIDPLFSLWRRGVRP